MEGIRRSESSPHAEQLRELDNAHVWHPFTAMSSFREEHAPIIVDADGFFLVDANGQRYLDGHSSLWCNIHGHRVPAIDDAIRAQLNRVAHTTLLGLSNEPSIELAAELVRRAPARLNKIFYADCGAAGVEVALKLAFQYHRQKSTGAEQRNLFACLGQAYHGDTVGTISLGGIDRFHSLFGSLMFPALRIPSPTESDDWEVTLEELLAKHADQLAGFVIEPVVQAAAGIIVHPPGYLTRVRELTRKYGILLIADEIAVGFGRTGTLFACEHENVVPDMLILSKGLTGGYLPLAATMVTDEIYNAFLGDPWAGRTFQHGHTYTGNPLACAAALASMRLFDENHLLDNVQQIEQVMRTELSVLTTSTDNVPVASIQNRIAAVRQRGAMVGIELSQDRQTRTPYEASRRMGHQVTLACRRRGLILRNIGDTIVLMPAPAMPVSLVTGLCRTVIESLIDVLTPN